MQATRNDEVYGTGKHLLLAFELSQKTWKLGFGDGSRRRFRTIPARDLDALASEIEQTKRKWELPADTVIYSCYEAGRDGFWLHRALAERGITNEVIDSSSIPVDRRARRAKSDGIDVQQLLDLLRRYRNGERKALRPVRVPSVVEEDLRRLHRERGHLVTTRTREWNRIKGLAMLHGLVIERIAQVSPRRIDALRDWHGDPLPPNLRAELERGYERHQHVAAQITTLEAEQLARLRTAGESGETRDPYALMQGLLLCKGIGIHSAWTLVLELFGWRRFNNPRQLGACVGLVPTPYQSGTLDHEQGISKAGSRRLRALLIELAWSWLRHQPDSALSRWFKERFAGSKRSKKVGIVALARRLLIALWRMTQSGALPDGAVVKSQYA